VRILTMTLMMTLSLLLMGSFAAFIASLVIVLLLAAGFALHLHHKNHTFDEARRALMNDYHVTVYGVLAVAGVFAGLPGLLYVLAVIMGQGELAATLREWFVLLGVGLRLLFALVSMVIFSSLYAVREEADRLHGQR
jgi:hypothetical protein